MMKQCYYNAGNGVALTSVRLICVVFLHLNQLIIVIMQSVTYLTSWCDGRCASDSNFSDLSELFHFFKKRHETVIGDMWHHVA